MKIKNNLNKFVLQHSSLVRSENGIAFRDLNKNGKLDIYEDPRQPVEARIDDLINQMTLQEKAGMLFIQGSVVNESGSLEGGEFTNSRAKPITAKSQMDQHKMTHFNLWEIPSSQALAHWSNNVQCYAEQTRLGIPVTLASDPRNHVWNYVFDLQPKDFSTWCRSLGLAAIRDINQIKQFARVVRQEYLATGIRLALHPQVDLATEPRWSRIGETFGEDAQLTSKIAKAYIDTLQGETLGFDSIACMVKHFPGGGPQKEGLDPHFKINKGQIYPGDNLRYHLQPFEVAFSANTAAVMLSYGIPIGQTEEDVAMSFNKTIVSGLIRGKYKFDGVVCTDWGVVTEHLLRDFLHPAAAWGVEHLSEMERVKKIFDAGVDLIGGENCPELLVALVQNGDISEERINSSVRRLLRMKFQLGLFDNPFIDQELWKHVFGSPDTITASMTSQSKAMTLLKNESHILPLAAGTKIYIENVDPSVASKYCKVASSPIEADLAVIRLATPWYPVDYESPIAREFHHGDLDFKGDAKESILHLLDIVPTIVVIGMDRPAVIPEISAKSKALLVEFGASDEAVLNVIFGRVRPEGKLPFELPSSMDAVQKQLTDMPYDSEEPLFPFGFGMSY